MTTCELYLFWAFLCAIVATLVFAIGYAVGNDRSYREYRAQRDEIYKEIVSLEKKNLKLHNIINQWIVEYQKLHKQS